MLGLITEKRHDQVVDELIMDRNNTLWGKLEESDKLVMELELCRQGYDRLHSNNIELQQQVKAYQIGCMYGLANHRITLSFYYGHYQSFSCRVTFTPELTDTTDNKSCGTKRRFGWLINGAPIPEDIGVIEHLFEEMNFRDWHWSTPDKQPVAYFENHDIAKIVESVSKFNDELQKQVNNILKAEQYLRIARAKEPEESKK